MQKEQYIFENVSKEKENKIRYYNKKIKED